MNCIHKFTLNYPIEAATVHILHNPFQSSFEYNFPFQDVVNNHSFIQSMRLLHIFQQSKPQKQEWKRSFPLASITSSGSPWRYTWNKDHGYSKLMLDVGVFPFPRFFLCFSLCLCARKKNADGAQREVQLTSTCSRIFKRMTGEGGSWAKKVSRLESARSRLSSSQPGIIAS